MSTRRLLVYLIALHAVILAGGFYLLRDQGVWVLVLEGVLILSLVVGLTIWNHQRVAARLLRDGTVALRDQDYSLRLKEVGVRDVDELISVYNRLLEQIRRERVDSQRREHFLSLLVESTSLGIVTLDFDGKLASINRWGREQLGLPPLSTVEGPEAA